MGRNVITVNIILLCQRPWRVGEKAPVGEEKTVGENKNRLSKWEKENNGA
jgi:hypothetical protein